MSANLLSPELRQEFEAIARHIGCELLQSTFKGGRLRLVLDRPEGPEGVNLSDCETVAKHVSAYLDVVDYGLDKYVLEVSSPGLDREFYSQNDYVRFSGNLVRVTWQSPEMAQKRTVVGRLEAFTPVALNPEASTKATIDKAETLESDATPQPAQTQAEGTGIVSIVEKESGEALQIPLSDIKITRLEIDQ